MNAVESKSQKSRIGSDNNQSWRSVKTYRKKKKNIEWEMTKVYIQKKNIPIH